MRKFRNKQLVWLKAFEDNPREQCTLALDVDDGDGELELEDNDMVVGYVLVPTHEGDDCLREFEVGQIE